MRMRDESGLALVIAVFVTGLMLMAGLAILSFTDTQTSLTRGAALELVAA